MNAIVESRSPATINRDGVVAKLIVARRALEEATTIREVKDVTDAAIVVEVWAKRQQLGNEVEMMARTIKLDAMRKLGEMLEKLPRHRGGNPNGSGPHASVFKMGISHAISSTAQRLASIPEDEFVALRDSRRSVVKFLHGEAVRHKRKRILKKGNLLDFPLPRGKLLRYAEKTELREAAEGLYAFAQTVIHEAKWLALVAAELGDGEKGNDVKEEKLQDLWKQASRKDVVGGRAP